MPDNTSEWQPIRTAPQDMTQIIGMDDKGRISRTWYFAPSSQTKGWLNGQQKWWKPLYWVPMPVAKLNMIQTKE